MNKLNAMILNCADNSSLYFNVNNVRETVCCVSTKYISVDTEYMYIVSMSLQCSNVHIKFETTNVHIAMHL